LTIPILTCFKKIAFDIEEQQQDGTASSESEEPEHAGPEGPEPDLQQGCLMNESTRLVFDLVNSLLGIFGLSIFVIIFVVLFLIFGNIDGKPWTTVFDN
jgi:hypothetical protein